MKRFILLLTAVVTLAAGTAFADRTLYSVQVFSSISGVSATARTYGNVYRLGDLGSHNFSLRGYHLGGITSAGVYQNMSGHSFAIQEAPTASGPWATAIGVGGSALAFTTSSTKEVGAISGNWKSASPFVRFVFTRATGVSADNLVSAWLYYSEDY